MADKLHKTAAMRICDCHGGRPPLQHLTGQLGETHPWSYSPREETEISQAFTEFPRHGRSHRTQKTPRPNYFFAVQINDPKVLEKAKGIQSRIVRNASSDLSHMTVDVRTSHLTLMAMYLHDSSSKEQAIQCLHQCIETAKKDNDCGNITLEFEGLDAFNGGSVLFIALKKSHGLQLLTSIADTITRDMETRGIMAAGHTFNPHLSLMKHSWEKAPRNSARRVERDAYCMYEKEYFGSHTVSSIQLCSMGSASEWNGGYYQVDHEVFLKLQP